MLARIAHELYWIGRQLSRAEHTARMLDGVFHADVQGRRDDAGVSLSWDALLAIMGAERSAHPATRDDVVQRLTLDRTNATSVASCVTQAREGARTVRDVFSAEMWEAINTFHLGLLRRDNSAALRTGPYSVYAFVKERCGLFWGVTGRTMLRDEAHAFLEAGARIEAADMMLRMLRVALPGAGEDGSDPHLRDGQALALLQAVGGFQAYRRAVPEPPNASCSTSAPIRTPSPRRSSRCTRRSRRPTPTTATRPRCCGSGGCRPTSTSARGRSTARRAA
jgi:uncharacterized alpha-E superfamily protein